MATKHQTLMKSLAVVSMILAVVYIIMPVDFDGPIIGILDDFLFFMAAFCFCQAQFISTAKASAKRMLNLLALVFLLLGALWVLVLAFTPIQNWVA